MPRYYFHLNDPAAQLTDTEGRMLEDITAARETALYEARALISADALAGRISLLPTILVEDDQGATLHTLPFASAVAIVPGE